MHKIQPCLWFDSQAEEAARLYTSLFKNSKMGQITRYGKSGANISGQQEGSVMTVQLEIDGLPITALNGGPIFKHTPALSFFVWCESEEEVDHLWKEISKGGQVRMNLDKYPWSQKYGWTTDRFGVEWQLMIADPKTGATAKIAPAFLFVDQLFGKGQEALDFYMSAFKDSRIEYMTKDENQNTIMHCVFSLSGNKFALMEGAGQHGFQFTEAFSLIVTCDTQEEMDAYFNKLSAHPESEQCGWLKDKYGVSWQITPAQLGRWINDPKTAEVAMREILKMKRPNIAQIQAAVERA